MIPQLVVSPNYYRVFLLLVVVMPLQSRTQQNVVTFLHYFDVVGVALDELIGEEGEVTVTHQRILYGCVAGDGVDLHVGPQLFQGNVPVSFLIHYF